MDNICEEISKHLQENPEGLRFKSIVSITKSTEPTISKHLMHLIDETKIRKKDLLYTWADQKIVSYKPPYNLQKAEIELFLNATKKDDIHHKITYTIQNQNEEPLSCIALHIWGDTERTWDNLNIKFFQIKNDERIELYKNKQKPENFVKNNPYEYNFQLKFQIPLYHNEVMKIIYEYDWTYKTADFTYEPSDNRPEEYNFKITHPKIKDYTINAYKVDASTLDKTQLPIKPSIKIEHNNKIWEWKVYYEVFQNYRVRVEWSAN